MANLMPTNSLLSALTHLAETIDDRANGKSGDDPSYTEKLLSAGPHKCAKKLGEEAVETVLAIASESDEEVAAETADLLYHLFVALRSRGVALDLVGEALAKRQGVSGIVEKNSRKNY